MNENSNKENDTQTKPYVIANPDDNPNNQNEVKTTPYVIANPDDKPVDASVKKDEHSSPLKNVDTSSTIRYNPVTGEEINTKELIEKKDETEILNDTDNIDNSEKLKTIEVDYQPASTANTVMLVLFFIFLIIFVIFLPDLQVLIAEYRAGDKEVEEIVTGTLVCELSGNTTNLDTNYERRFDFTEKKLKTAKFITKIRGSESLDGEVLDETKKKCDLVRDNLENISGARVSCLYESGTVTETEIFDYSSYNEEEVIAAYTEAGADLPEFKLDQDLDSVKTLMSRSGFSCTMKGNDTK